VDFDPKKFKHLPVEALNARKFVLIANARNLEKSAPGLIDERRLLIVDFGRELARRGSSFPSCAAHINNQQSEIINHQSRPPR